MKNRNDFVTNSSSSSYVIAYKYLPEIDEETLTKYPILRCFNELLDTILFSASSCTETTEGEKITNEKELQVFMLDNWCYGTIEEAIKCEGNSFKTEYERCLNLINQGYTILSKQIDYSDETLANMFDLFAKNNTGIELISSG